ncbi:MAG: pyridoxamine 5'-phosphate oxidase family protein [Chloroflexota bacterium]|nr:pyridoxamine 5'-phosphate oxidase family protein [Chloroflexota bacterium]MDQ5865269.1 pyridoxamine 5'-phosphate oxidase family protein [Chloroflexota bacterium]
MPSLQLPSEVVAVLRNFYTCEYTTVNRQGQPVTWPSVTYFDEGAGMIVAAVSVAFPVKAYNARRHPQVSMLYSDPTGSGLEDPPAVLVQGDARVAEVLEYTPPIIGLFKKVRRQQPDSAKFTANNLTRNLFVWYLFQRIALVVEPRRILVWPHRDFSQAPSEVEVRYVE